MMMRFKMECSERAEQNGSFRITLTCILGDAKEDRGNFVDAKPSGEFTLRKLNANGAQLLTPGQVYNVEVSKV